MSFLGALCGVQLLAAVILLSCLRIAWELLFSPLRAFPGPFAAKFTNFWRAFLTTLGHVDDTSRAWHEKWGKAVRIGPNVISLSDPDLIKVVYASSKRNAWRKQTGNMYRVNDVMIDGQRIPNIFNTQDDGFHDRHSKPIGGLWTMTKILEMEPLMDETITTFANKLGTRFADTSGPGDSTCIMDDWLAYFSWDFSAQMAFGKHYGFIDEGRDVGGMIAESAAGLSYFAALSQVPQLDNWLDKNPIIRIGPRPLVNGFNHTVNLLADYQKQLADGTPVRKRVDAFVDKYTHLKDFHDFVDDAQVTNWLMLIILAGGDSTAGALRPVVYYLGKHPEVQRKLQAELNEARLSIPAQWKDIQHLCYLDAVLRESMRLSPALGLMFEREVPSGGFQLADGRFIPEGTNVGINPTVVTRDAEVYGEYVDGFIPERWLQRPQEEFWQFSRRRRRMEEVADLMFGAGTRVCMGKHLAKIEIYKLIATLYILFDINLPDVKHEWKPFNAWFMYQTDMPMVIHRRFNTGSCAQIPHRALDTRITAHREQSTTDNPSSEACFRV